MSREELPIPPHFHPERAGEIWRVPYQARAGAAETWARTYRIKPSAKDRFRICLVPVDVQNTFCIPGFELYVAGRSGTGAVNDSRRLSAFIYRNLDILTEICPTMDTHQAIQIFHSIFLTNERGEHPAPFTLISEEDVKQGVWRFNPAIGDTLGIDETYGNQYLLHYVQRLKKGGKYDLTIWPYHAMLGGIGFALVPLVEESIFFHSVARCGRIDFQAKGDNPLTENYSVLSPEVLEDTAGKQIARKNARFVQKLLKFDAILIAGQAKSHCVAWTVGDLLEDVPAVEEKLAQKVYLLEDCTSPVVVPGLIDYTEQADLAFRRFAEAGMHLVHSTDPVESWPGIEL